jgi:ER membrane protein SH3
VTKLYRPSEANLLFDGASLVLYMCGIIVYVANIVQGLRVTTAGVYGAEAAAALGGATGEGATTLAAEVPVSREDSLRVLAASNTILALVLVGVLVLQAGQWYAQHKEEVEIEEMKKKTSDEKRRATKKKS